MEKKKFWQQIQGHYLGYIYLAQCTAIIKILKLAFNEVLKPYKSSVLPGLITPCGKTGYINPGEC